jgi:hypothetical protein
MQASPHKNATPQQKVTDVRHKHLMTDKRKQKQENLFIKNM